MMFKKIAFIGIVTVSACVPQIPKEALQLSQESPALQRLQTRRFETRNEQALLSAGGVILKELGFTIDASEGKLGMMVGSKTQSADNLGEKVATTALSIIAGAFGLPVQRAVSKDQMVTASVVTRAGENRKDTVVRVTFQLVVWNTEQKVTHSGLLEEPELYRGFFEKLSKAVSLKAYEF